MGRVLSAEGAEDKLRTLRLLTCSVKETGPKAGRDVSTQHRSPPTAYSNGVPKRSNEATSPSGLRFFLPLPTGFAG
jgi:hypothetical protein